MNTASPNKYIIFSRIHIKLVHEEKKQFKCDISDNSCAQNIRQSILYYSLYIISSCATTPSASSLFLSYQTARALGCTSFTALSLFPEAIKIWNSIFFCVPAASACAPATIVWHGGEGGHCASSRGFTWTWTFCEDQKLAVRGVFRILSCYRVLLIWLVL